MCHHSQYDAHIVHIFFFNDTATTEIYTLSLHDALPISYRSDPWTNYSRNSNNHSRRSDYSWSTWRTTWGTTWNFARHLSRSEEHTSELQSQSNLVCRLLLEKKKTTDHPPIRFNPDPEFV